MSAQMNNKEMRLRLFMAYGTQCACSKECTKQATDIHHIKHNTSVNRSKYPLFLESPFNKIPLNNECHLNKPLPKQPSDFLCNIYEEYLYNLLHKAEEKE